jgi:hypothetical protein
LRSGQPATVSAMSMATVPSGRSSVAHHAQVDDAAAQLGILDGAQGVDDLIVRDCGHRSPGCGGEAVRRNYHYAHR